MKTTRLYLNTAAILTIAAACSGPGRYAPDVSSATSSLREAAQPRITGSHKRLTRGEMQFSDMTTAWDAVRRLRPEFLTPRPVASPNGHGSLLPTVYLNGIRQGSLEALHTIPVDAIVDIRYVNARAMREWLGQRHERDAIIVRTTIKP